MVIVYGNCHTSIIAKMLEASPEFIEKYYIYPTERIQNITDPKDLYDDCYSQCDVFIHQSIRLNNRYGEEYASERIIARLKPGCKVIAIPNVYHLPLCFFPQYYDAHELKNENVKNCTTFFFRDAIIDSHLKNVKELYKLYTHVNKDYNAPLLYNNDEIVSSFNLFVDKVRVREKDWDIKVSQFILDNYKQHQLFYDPNHPTNYFLKYVTSELLKLLVDNRTVDDICEIKETLENIEYPVCQSVIAALGLEWKESSIRRNSPGTKWIPFKMTLFWYTYQYFIFVWMARDYPKSVRVLSKILWYNNYFYFILFKAIRKLYRLYNS